MFQKYKFKFSKFRNLHAKFQELMRFNNMQHMLKFNGKKKEKWIFICLLYYIIT